MAEVFDATAAGEAGFERRVAIKRIRMHYQGLPHFEQMFLDEARIASQLHHAGIVGVVDYGLADGQPFQVLEFVDGASLRELMHQAKARQRAIPIEVALHICSEVAHALDYAHSACDASGASLGIVHRDVKPDNILVSKAGVPKLADFGIALASNRGTTTEAGVAKGTLLYMAPEQSTGGRVGPQADCFALACVAHELIAGTSPLAGESRLFELLQGVPLPIDPSVPDDVAAILRAGLALDQRARHPSAGALAEAFRACVLARTSRDPRALTKELVAELTSAEVAPSAGRLDDLLNIELILDRDEGGARSFATRHLKAPSSAAEGAIAPTMPAEPADEEAPSLLATMEAEGSRRRLVWIAAAVVLGLAAVGAVGFRVATLSSESSAEAVHPPPQPIAATVVDAAPVVSEAPDAANVGLAAGADAAPAQRPGPVPRRTSVQPDKDREASPPRAREPRATEAITGHLRIGGQGALGLAIYVDGRRNAYAPRTLELESGSHRIELRDRSGATKHSRTVQIDEAHTQSRPERWIVD